MTNSVYFGSIGKRCEDVDHQIPSQRQRSQRTGLSQWLDHPLRLSVVATPVLVAMTGPAAGRMHRALFVLEAVLLKSGHA
ncbi:hypothetical protein [Thalassoroseus pseudoceratinae]|uniref:hypothetical protein n=1 Tax=Thalassoroseus pseudoceratinae TaxID=2713176 RepID=UPI0014217FCE|nr:hypothetical protein [Thalassoroseus pseudoceratinae]